ncbi:DNA polymerase family B-domain-containing protein [Endogone sp. FLAS-F59071]|nr:DNA polymerase family B-domain-containing protein [Endogone sp. FLAS-F59071]|eukprot:RUS21275.1 DNA polymerase family B-domain-containing protein [Endogone sp. FLAS-F59071]
MDSPSIANTRQKRRATEKKPGEKYAMLRELKLSGKSYLDTYKVREEHSIYETVTEEDYQTIVKGRLQEDDFVIDDDGSGYVDNGLEDWDREGEPDESDEDEEADVAGRTKGKGDKKRKRAKKDDADKVKVNGINNFFKRGTANAGVTKKVTTTANEEDFMADLFKDLENDVPQSPSIMSRSARPNQLPMTPTSLPRRPLTHRLDDPTTFAPPSTRNSLPRTTSVPVYDDEDMAPPKSEPAEDDTVDAFADDFGNDDTVDAFADAFDDDDIDLEAVMMEVDPPSDAVKPEPVPELIRLKPLQTQARDAHKPVTVVNASAHVVRPKPPPAPQRPTVVKPDVEGYQAWKAARAEIGGFGEGNAAATPQQGPAYGPGIGAAAEMKVLEEDGSLRIWWLDAYERQGVVYMFGKVFDRVTKAYVSCCVTINGIERNLFVLPRAKKMEKDNIGLDQEVTMKDVYNEFDAVCTRHRISKWGAKEVVRKYAFEVPGVPGESDYLKVVYSFEEPQLPNDLSGATFSHIFGTATTALELFLIKRNIMGPCWLEIKNAQISNKNISWCRVEIVVEDPKMVNPFKDGDRSAPQHAPPLVVMSLSMRTVMNHQKHMNEIAIIGAVVFQQVNIEDMTPIEKQPKQAFTVVRHLDDIPFPFLPGALHRQQPQIRVEKTELAMMNYLIGTVLDQTNHPIIVANIQKADPDIIVGHNFVGFDLDVLLHRMKALRIEHWSRIGRLKRSQWPKLQAGAGGMGDTTYSERMVMSGRLMCDTYLAAKELIRSKSYSLTQLATSQLGIKREDIEYDRVPVYFASAPELVHVISHCEFDAILAAGLMFKLQVLPLMKQLTNLAGNLWSRTMVGGRAERNEYLLLHEFHKNKFVCPDKIFGKVAAVPEDDDDDGEKPETTTKKGGRRKPAYSGGLVLEPKKGFYDKFVLLLDFNSLYPSIIQEYNICFTTVQRGESLVRGRRADSGSPGSGIAARSVAARNQEPRRSEARGEEVNEGSHDVAVKDGSIMAIYLLFIYLVLATHLMTQLDIRQKALKLTANSMYGCLGFPHSRFYAKPLAMLITSKGREILQNTVDLAEGQNLNVIYGDTDSIMIYTNESEVAKVREIGNEFKKKVNERYKLLEIEIDGLFQHMLLLKKKKYAALVVEERDGALIQTIETKGLDIVRRDWCGLSHDSSEKVLGLILSELDREEVVDQMHKYLQQVGQETRAGLIPIDKFVINKGLTKNPEDYADAKNQPHVQVALRLKKRGISIRAGDTVPYAICTAEGVVDGTKFAERAYHPDDVRREGSGLQIDIEWYLSQQVHPPIARLCAPIEGTDTARIADCLGLDPSRFHTASIPGSVAANELYTLDSQISDEERFRDVELFKPRCQKCLESNVFQGVVRREGDLTKPGLVCPNNPCDGVLSVHSLQAQLLVAIRAHVRRYYDGWMVCDSCESRTRMVSVYGKRCLKPSCSGGTMASEYSDTALYTQLLYYSSLFDFDKAKKRSEKTEHGVIEQVYGLHRETFTALKKLVDQYLERSGRKYVNLSRLFNFCKI